MNRKKNLEEKDKFLVFRHLFASRAQSEEEASVIKKTNRKQYKPNIWFFLKSHPSKHAFFSLQTSSWTVFCFTSSSWVGRERMKTVGKCSFFNEFLKGPKRLTLPRGNLILEGKSLFIKYAIRWQILFLTQHKTHWGPIIDSILRNIVYVSGKALVVTLFVQGNFSAKVLQMLFLSQRTVCIQSKFWAK